MLLSAGERSLGGGKKKAKISREVQQLQAVMHQHQIDLITPSPPRRTRSQAAAASTQVLFK